jgi:hypothetical protein
MPDFDANEDHVRLGDSAKDEHFELPLLRPRFSARSRELAVRECFGARKQEPARVPRRLATGRRRAAGRACSAARSNGPLAAGANRRRRLWTTCHGRVPGSSS